MRRRVGTLFAQDLDAVDGRLAAVDAAGRRGLHELEDLLVAGGHHVMLIIICRRGRPRAGRAGHEQARAVPAGSTDGTAACLPAMTFNLMFTSCTTAGMVRTPKGFSA
jgi:hypothetical protein